MTSFKEFEVINNELWKWFNCSLTVNNSFVLDNHGTIELEDSKSLINLERFSSLFILERNRESDRNSK